jgi:hypothetical protein
VTDHTKRSALYQAAEAVAALLDAHKCPGGAACCYGTELLATCQEEQDVLDAAVLLGKALLRMRKPHEKGA